MSTIRVSAKTVSDAITEASIQLGVVSTSMEYKVIEEGSAGFLGIGRKQAVIEAWKKEEKPVKIKETTKKRKIDREENKDIKQENKKASSNVIQNKKTNNMKKTKKVNKNIDKK